jgi:uncharacterized protein
VKRNATRVLWLAIAAVLFAVPTLAQTPLPVPTGQVNDFANVVDAASRERMETMARNFRDRTGVDVAVVTLASLEGRPLEDVAIDMARSWGIGAGTDKDGLLVLLAVEDRRSRIETSRKLDDEITDGTAGAILRLGRPFFQEGRYGEGLTAVVESALATIAEKRGISIEGIDRSRAQREAPPRQPARDGGSSGLSRIIFLVVLILVISAISRGGGGGRGGRRRRYGGGPWIIPFPIGWGGGGGGSWGSSGGGGGSWGGGGDSWGGFGGGGDFGGGGASDSW